jgi:signal transduction histidine kinase
MALKSQISRLQALANIGTTTCMVAHEINNLLTPLAGYAACAINNPDDKTLSEKALQKTVQNCQRASQVMESMVALANGETGQKKNTRLITLVEQIFSSLCRDFSKDRIKVKNRIPEDLTVWAVPVQIQQVLMNLILNARDAMLPRGGVLTIEACNTDDAIQIQVCDTGCGIEPTELSNIFEPFSTTKADKKWPSGQCGSGLGLAFCKQVVESHGGSISVESQPAEKTTFIMTLPKKRKT